MGWIGLIAAPDLAYAKLVAPIILASLRCFDGNARRPEHNPKFGF
jgi:hypothetical protein